MEKARNAVVSVEKEINTIKSSLRELGSKAETTTNRIVITNLTENTSLTIQCSSPVESHVLEKDVSGTFEEVDTSVATFQFTLSEGSEIYSSDALDALDVMEEAAEFHMDLGTLEYTSVTKEKEIILFLENENKEDGEEETNSTSPADEDDEKQDAPTSTSDNDKDDEVEEIPSKTISISIHFTPGTKDKTEKLYDMLNRAVKKKETVINDLRKVASAMSREAQQSSTGDATSKSGGKAVKAGFLNSSKTSSTTTKLTDFYKKWSGRVIGIFLVTKEYLLFFGGVALIHYQGHQLALPAPV